MWIHLSWEQAAAVPLAGLTAWRAVVTQAEVTTGQTVLVTGAGSGAAATLDATRANNCGQGQLFIAGGVWSMSRTPWVLGWLKLLPQNREPS